MAELLLDSLEIKGYRCFEHLTIEKLGRVNLIVGKNNVGKTALLEALWIYGNLHKKFTFYEILDARNELPQRIRNNNNTLESTDHENYRHFFSGRPHPIINADSYLRKVHFTIGSTTNDSERLRVELIQSDEDALPEIIANPSQGVRKFNTHFIQMQGLVNETVEKFWEKVQMRDLEDLVITALKILKKDLISVRLIEYHTQSGEKIPVARLADSETSPYTEGDELTVSNLVKMRGIKDYSEPIPLRSLGEGMNRLFGLSLALVNCRDGILLIDEIESGLHYSVLPDVWKLIFKTAKDLNVQVFATTHSKDCIEAFTQAAIDDEESEGMLIRLERNKDDKIIAKTIEEENLALAVDYGAEVR